MSIKKEYLMATRSQRRVPNEYSLYRTDPVKGTISVEGSSPKFPSPRKICFGFQGWHQGHWFPTFPKVPTIQDEEGGLRLLKQGSRRIEFNPSV